MSRQSIRALLRDFQVRQIELESKNEELCRIQAALDAARDRYFNLYNLAPVGYLTVSEAGLILEANLTAATLLGETRSALVKRPLPRFIFKEDQDAYALNRKQLVASDESQCCELRMVKKDATVFWARLESSVARDVLGRPMGCLMLSDITERKQTELRLREWSGTLEQRVLERTHELQDSEARFRQLADATFEGVAISEDGILLNGNLRFARMHDYELTEMLGRPMGDFIAPESWALVAERRNDPDEAAYKYFGRRKDGSLFPAEVRERSGPWMGRSTRITALRDLTAVKQAAAKLHELEDELGQAQRFALVSEISAGIIHQLGQPLSAIWVHLSAMKMLKGKELQRCGCQEFIMDIESEVARMKDITVHLRALVNPMQPTRQPTDVNAIVTDLMPLLRKNTGSSQVRLGVDLGRDLPPVHADAVQISEVILNLVRNASEASATVPPERRTVVIATRAQAGTGVELSVCDAGSGISPETMSRLFSPFFSTKPDGLGIGLRLSKTILEAHHGSIEGFNNPDGNGATFRLVLPTTTAS